MDNDSAPVKSRAGVWHHQVLSRLRAEELLLEAKVDGAFLVRDSETVQNAHVLSLLHQGRMHHYRILCDEQRGKHHMKALPGVNVQYFEKLNDLVTFYGQPNQGLPCELRVPVVVHQESQEEDSEDEDEEDQEEGEEQDLQPIDNVDGASKSPIYDTLPLKEKAAEIGTDNVDDSFHAKLSNYLGGAINVDLDAVSAGDTKLEELQKLIASSSRDLNKHMRQFLSRVMLLKKVFSVGGESDKMSFSIPQSCEGKSAEYEQLLDMMARGIAGCKSLQAQAVRALKELGDLKPQNGEEEAKSRTFEVSTQTALATKTKMYLDVDVHAGKISFLKSLNDAQDGNNTYEQSKVLQLIKSRTNIKRLAIKLESLKTLKEFDFDAGKSREVFCQIVQQMKNQHSSCEAVKNISIFIGTWNMGDANPPEDIQSWYKCQGRGKPRDVTLSRFAHAIYAIGTQECSLSEKDWVTRIKTDLKNMFGEDFKVVVVCTLWSIRLVVLVKQCYEHLISHTQISSVKTGIANRLGNKGAAAASFMFGATSLCFVNCHLAARSERVLRRNQNFHDILKGLRFDQKSTFDITHQFHHVFWFGDLNYRIVNLEIEEIQESLKANNLCKLKMNDQLKEQKEEGRVFFQFKEDHILFPPTYRFKRESTGTHDYVYIKTKRAGNITNLPSWCDRVLWHSFPEASLASTSYGRVENVRSSDHWPVFSSFDMKVISQSVSSTDGRVQVKPNEQGCKITFETIKARIKTNSKTQFIIEFHSGCLEAITKSEMNSTTDWHHYGCFDKDPPKKDPQSVHHFSYPSWSKSVLPTLEPLISNREYIEDQFLLLAVKSVDGDESYGECCIALRVMIAETKQAFEAVLTHFGEVTGQIRGEMLVQLPQDNRPSESASQDLIREDLDEVYVNVSKPPKPALRKSIKLQERHSALISSERRPSSPQASPLVEVPFKKRPVSQPESTGRIQNRELPPPPVERSTVEADLQSVAPPLPAKRSVKPQTVEEMMRKIGLPQYTSNLTENGWDKLEFLRDLGEEDLEEASVPEGFWKQILAAAMKYGN